MVVTCVKLCSQVTKMARAEAPRAFQANLDGQPPDKQIRSEDVHLKARSKTVIVSVFACKLKDLAKR